MREIDFSLATTGEIIKELASRAKQKRKRNSTRYGTQKEFAAHIGMSFRSYQEFEISGKITLEKFIDVLRGLDAIEDTQELLKIKDVELFEEHKNRKKFLQK
jgi:transcriptional regulator with XRE-family HTH domain